MSSKRLSPKFGVLFLKRTYNWFSEVSPGESQWLIDNASDRSSRNMITSQG